MINAEDPKGQIPVVEGRAVPRVHINRLGIVRNGLGILPHVSIAISPIVAVDCIVWLEVDCPREVGHCPVQNPLPRAGRMLSAPTRGRYLRASKTRCVRVS